MGASTYKRGRVIVTLVVLGMLLVTVVTWQSDGGAYPEDVTVSVVVNQGTVFVTVATTGEMVMAVDRRQRVLVLVEVTAHRGIQSKRR